MFQAWGTRSCKLAYLKQYSLLLPRTTVPRSFVVRKCSAQVVSTTPKPKRLLFRKFLLGIVGLGTIVGGIAYASLDAQGKRKVRVGRQGLVRFMR